MDQGVNHRPPQAGPRCVMNEGRFGGDCVQARADGRCARRAARHNTHAWGVLQRRRRKVCVRCINDHDNVINSRIEQCGDGPSKHGSPQQHAVLFGD